MLIRSIRKIYPKVTIFAFNSPSEIHPECPPHAFAPYAFKVYAVEHARARGYNVVIWLDTPNRLIRRIEPWLEEIAKVGVYLQHDGFMTGQWANDKCLQYFGVTRDEAMQIPNIYACIYGFDFRHPITAQFFARWKQACKDGMFYGKGKNTDKTESRDERCLGHRYDQTCAELVAHQLGIPHSPLVLGETKYFLSWIDV
jgi:hypothetical protein